MKTPKQQHSHRKLFYRRITSNIGISFLIILFSLLLGMWGYHYFETISWLDAYLNAAMILSGIRPVADLQTVGGKIFAGSYALFSGILFLIVIAFILVPLFHHLFHKVLIEEKN